MEFRTLGHSGLKVPALSFGTGTFGGGNEFFRAWGASDVAEATRLVDICLEAGVNLFDTADIYSDGLSETILGKAIAGRRDDVLISTKATFRMGPGPNDLGSSRYHLIRACEASLRRLGTDYIDIYRPARVDPAVPIEDTIGAIADMVRAGYVRYIGLSEAGAETIRRAHAVHPIVDLQIEYSLMSRGVEAAILPVTRQLGIAITAYGVLSRGLLSGRVPAADTKGDIRVIRMPRFKHGNIENNLRLVDALRRIGNEKGATPAQLALA